MTLTPFPPLVRGCATCQTYTRVIGTALFLGESETAEGGRRLLARHLSEDHGIAL